MWWLLGTIYLCEKLFKAFILLESWWYFGQRVARELDHSVCSPFTMWYVETPHFINRCFSETLIYGQVKNGTSLVVQAADVIIHMRKGRK